MIRKKGRKEGRKERVFLTTHSTHFIYGYMASNIIMVKNNLSSERGNPQPQPFLISSNSTKITITSGFTCPAHTIDVRHAKCPLWASLDYHIGPAKNLSNINVFISMFVLSSC